MKKMLCAALLAVLLSACENEAYDKGEGKYSLTQADFVEAYTNGDKAVSKVVTDDGTTLTLTKLVAADWITTADSTYRAVLYYNKVDSNSAQPVSLTNINVFTHFYLSSEIDMMNTDPITFESAWKSRNGKYINVSTYIKTSQTTDENMYHSLGLINEGLQVNADGTTTMRLHLYHDQGGIPEYYSQKYYFSILCDSVIADSLSLVINTYDGEVTKKFGL